MSYVLERFLITFGMTLFFFLSPIINVLSDFFNCTELHGNSYVTNYLIEKCDGNPTYDFWKYRLIIPSFVVFGILTPFFTFYYMWRKKDHLFEDMYICKIGFLLNGYSSKNFYW